MTGYGKSVATWEDKKICVEVRSLNGKAMDLSARLAPQYKSREMEVRTLVSNVLERGKVDLAIWVEQNEKMELPSINVAVMQAYVNQIQAASEQTGVAVPDNLFEVLLRMPDVLKNEQKELSDEEWTEAVKVIDQAVEAFSAFRTQEGKGLQAFFMQKIDNIRALLAQVPQYEAARIDKIRARLEENLRALDDKLRTMPIVWNKN